jgi:alanine racemase
MHCRYGSPAWLQIVLAAMIKFSQLAEITGGEILTLAQDIELTIPITDSRKANASEGAIFFAIKGEHHDGHHFLKALYQSGIRQFVIEYQNDALSSFGGCNVIKVKSSIRALQLLAAYHRSMLHVPVIGITGSNGKTIIKEWLFQLLSDRYNIAKNPGSYNSQLGVPLSVWQLQAHHQLGIFEAGISKPGEMERLEEIIQPTVGVFTNIGPAHDEGFENTAQKIDEKLKLFKNSEVVLYCHDHELLREAIQFSRIHAISWGFAKGADIEVSRSGNSFEINYKNWLFALHIPFADQASIENALHCVCVMLYLGYDPAQMSDKLKQLRSVPMRLELKEGVNQSQVIDDTYNNDLAGLQISLDFLSNQKQKKKKRVILSDILESGLNKDQLAKRVADLISHSSVNEFVGIGPMLSDHAALFPNSSLFYSTTGEFLQHFDFSEIQQEIVLVKGARIFQFEKIVNKLQRRVHGTVMEIDLGAVAHNLNYFKARLRPETKVMVMVKAFAYGSGSTEIANLLQYHKVNYLGVAYADEGVDLRKNNISLPIMVMNPSEESFENLLDYNLEPEIYSFGIFERYLKFLNGRKARIHIKLDTGMHRLGFEENDLESLGVLLNANPNITVASIFSHLAGADEAEHDAFSREQADRFKKMADKLSLTIGAKPLYHILNSPGILRLPELQFDMVRLGIGLYGVDPTKDNFIGLKPVASLKTMISQIREVKAGETVGYGRRGKAEHDMVLGTIAIGYADGFSRSFSRGVGEVLVQNKRSKVVGNVCMDMTMIDLTGIRAKEGDEVIIFGKDLSIQSVAEKINTIPYEILTSTSERVKRVFVAESI